MIYESYPWKKDLLRQKNLLMIHNAPLNLKKNYDDAYTVVEKAIFYSAFIIRKLIDSGSKLSDEANNYTLTVYGIEPLKPVNQLCRCPEEDTHNWNNEKKISISGKVICNSLIHSYLFFMTFNESSCFESFCVSSDFDRNKMLYRITLDEWLKFIDYIATDDVVRITSHYNNKIRDYVYTRKERNKI